MTWSSSFEKIIFAAKFCTNIPSRRLRAMYVEMKYRNFEIRISSKIPSLTQWVSELLHSAIRIRNYVYILVCILGKYAFLRDKTCNQSPMQAGQWRKTNNKQSPTFNKILMPYSYTYLTFFRRVLRGPIVLY